MKTITLTQPWASLVAVDAKHIETRSWQTSYRGPLAIHAAKGLGPVGGMRGLQALCTSEFFYPALYVHIDRAADLPRGAIVATCELVDCVPTTYIKNVKIIQRRQDLPAWLWTEQEKAFGDYADGRWAWLLANIVILPKPISAKGALGLWEWQE